MTIQDENFDRCIEEYFETFMQRFPPMATFMGIHKYDHLMPIGTKKEMLELIALYRRFGEELRSFRTENLSPDKRIDRNCALHFARLQLYNMVDLEMWKKSPTAADVVGMAIFPLFAKDFSPLDERMEKICSRLEKSPLYIEETKEQLESPVKLWVEIEMETCARMKNFLMLILMTAKGKGIDGKLVERLSEAVAKTDEVLVKYKNWLSSEILPKCKTEWVIGRKKFEELLELREIGMTADQVLQFGETNLKLSKERLQSLAKQIDETVLVDQIREKIRENHPPTFEDAMNEYKKSIKEARDFVLRSDFASIPPNEELEIIETPSYIRHVVPFAAYIPPGRFDKNQKGLYLVTPVEDSPERLKEHSYPSILNTSVHEGYPGHHLQLVCANQHPSLARIFAEGTEFVEGWAHYCEDLMSQKGYHPLPEIQFLRELDVIWRAVRVIVDVKLSCGEMSFDYAVDFLVKETGMEKSSAIAEVKRYTTTPTYQLSYLLGKHQIFDLKDKIIKRFGDRFSEKKFHDAMLYAGSLPMKYMEKVVDERMEE